MYRCNVCAVLGLTSCQQFALPIEGKAACYAFTEGMRVRYRVLLLTICCGQPLAVVDFPGIAHDRRNRIRASHLIGISTGPISSTEKQLHKFLHCRIICVYKVVTQVSGDLISTKSSLFARWCFAPGLPITLPWKILSAPNFTGHKWVETPLTLARG